MKTTPKLLLALVAVAGLGGCAVYPAPGSGPYESAGVGYGQSYPVDSSPIYINGSMGYQRGYAPLCIGTGVATAPAMAAVTAMGMVWSIARTETGTATACATAATRGPTTPTSADPGTTRRTHRHKKLLLIQERLSQSQTGPQPILTLKTGCFESFPAVQSVLSREKA